MATLMANQESSGYRFREFYIPKHIIKNIRRYIDHGIIPGDFLQAVIKNDLRGACAWADDENLKNLPAFVAYFYNKSPSACWGSHQKMKRWAAWAAHFNPKQEE